MDFVSWFSWTIVDSGTVGRLSKGSQKFEGRAVFSKNIHASLFNSENTYRMNLISAGFISLAVANTFKLYLEPRKILWLVHGPRSTFGTFSLKKSR